MPLEKHFDNFNNEVSETVSRLQKLSRLSDIDNISQSNSALSSLPALSRAQSPEESANLPCFIYPSAKTSCFSDRTDDIIEMDRYFGSGVHDPENQLRSIALYGVGGVGKSSVAL